MLRVCRLYILDDDQSAIDKLKDDLMKTRHILVGTSTDPMAAIGDIHKQDVDVLFLDMQMQPITGMEVMPQLPPHVRVIFCTSHRDLAAMGYETYYRHYLLKPFGFQQLCTVLDQTIATLPRTSTLGNIEAEKKSVFVPKEVKGSYVRMWYEHVQYGCALGGDKVQIHLKDGGSMCINKRIGILMKSLPRDQFARISKDMFVRLDAILAITSGKIKIECDGRIIELDMGNRYAKDLYNWVKDNLL